MKRNAGRRSFLKKIGVTSITAGVLPATILEPPAAKANGSEKSKSGKQKSTRPHNEAYTGENLSRVAFPIGGLGAGNFCLEGTGAISHMSVRNKPDVFNEPGSSAQLRSKVISRLPKFSRDLPPIGKDLDSLTPVMDRAERSSDCRDSKERAFSLAFRLGSSPWKIQTFHLKLK